MAVLAVFNPEHDLCLANGNAHYVPPRSARDFARSHAEMMRWMFDDKCVTTDVEKAGDAYRRMIDAGVSTSSIVVEAWGWDSVVWNRLSKAGIPEALLPDYSFVQEVKRLSHRAACLPLQPRVMSLHLLADVEQQVFDLGDAVLKAPWSGSGRGLRWVSRKLSQHDIHWASKVLLSQGVVMVEPRYHVVQDFAAEFYADRSGKVSFVGWSLFETSNGVYRGNRLLDDNEIVETLSRWVPRTEIEAMDDVVAHLQHLCQGGYCGPIGVDMFVYEDFDGFHVNHCVEANFRYTMGMVASSFLRKHRECHGNTLFQSPGLLFHV